jgi:hypothetical protein
LGGWRGGSLQGWRAGWRFQAGGVAGFNAGLRGSYLKAYRQNLNAIIQKSEAKNRRKTGN